MAQPQMLQIKLSRFDAQPWGFRLQGGVDFAAPLLVQKVNGGSLAEKAGLIPGDAVLKINDVDVFNLRHKDAQDIVVRSGNNFVMTIQRGGSTWRPHVTPTGQMPQHNQSPYLQTVTKTSLAHKQQESQHIGCGYNNSARPFANGGDGSLKSIVNKQYNTPVGIYSDESIAETLSAQAEVLAGGVLGVNFKKNEKEYQAEKSEVLKFLREEESGQSTPAFNSHQQYQDPQQHHYQQQQQQPPHHHHHHHHPQQQQQQQEQQQQQSTTRHVNAPINTPKPPSTGGLPVGQNICYDCERLITPANFYWTQSHAIGGNERRTPISHQNQQQRIDERIGTPLHQNTLAPAAPHRPSLPQAATKPEPSNTEGSSDPRAIIIPVCPALQGPDYKAEMEAAAVAAAAAAADDGSGGQRPLSASGHPPCSMCGVGIVGVFVRIKDKNLHVECFKCATCGTSLKNQGYYNFNNKLYCDIHAKLAAQQHPPTGTEGYVPVPIKPNTKLSATTISAALNAHGYNNGVANGDQSTPTPAPHEIPDLPLPPPPSPTQLQQFQNDAQELNLVKSQNDHQHTNINNNLSTQSFSLTSNSPRTVVGSTNNSWGSATADINPLDRLGTPLHSHQSSSSSVSASASAASTSSEIVTDGYNNTAMETSVTLKPPPPPPMPIAGAIFKSTTPMSVADNKRFNNGVNSMLQEHGATNENDMNTQNKTSTHAHNAYNKLLKEYSNKLLTKNSNNNEEKKPIEKELSTQNTYNTNSNKNKTEIHDSIKDSNKILKGHSTPKSSNSVNKSAATSSNVAAITATLANQLKFHPNQISSPATVAPTSSFVNSNNFDQELSRTNESINMSLTTSALPYETQSIYGQMGDSVDARIESQVTTQSSNSDKPFEYVTLTGNVIRSVVPPGKGANINYRVNQGYVRPFGSSPAAPPAAAPKSPISYPPPASNPYATLPRTNVGQQGRYVHYSTSSNYSNNYSTQYRKPQKHVAPNKYATMPHYRSSTPSYNTSNISNSYNSHTNNYNIRESNEINVLEPQYAEECFAPPLPLGAAYYEGNLQENRELRQARNNFLWPPRKEDNQATPTAAPLYIPPPETQHVIAKQIQDPPPLPTDTRGKPKEKEEEEPEVVSEIPNKADDKPHWQSFSAPQLMHTTKLPELESSSDSYTSTCTTTTNTSEEYQRMYAAQMQAIQMQHMTDQSGSELDYHTDMDLDQVDMSYSGENMSGRRSAQECVESLVMPLNTYKLVDMVREVTPSPVVQSSTFRRVVFNDEPEIKVLPILKVEQGPSYLNETVSFTTCPTEEPKKELEQSSYDDIEHLIIEDRSHIIESQRIFQPTPEIKIEIPPVRQIPPTKIPNPTPKEWINPMIRALTTAPEVPFHMVDCLCPKPCECDCQADPVANKNPYPPPCTSEPSLTEQFERAASPVPSIETNVLREAPPRGTQLTKAMMTAPEFTVRFAPQPTDIIPLPEETEPYMPPPIDMKPYIREDFRPKSPFLNALIIAPEKPFESHFDRDVPIHEIDLPTPKAHLTMSDALCTASDRPYTPLNPENALHMFGKAENERQEKQKVSDYEVLGQEKEPSIFSEPIESVQYYITDQKPQASAFAAMQAFQPRSEPLKTSTAHRDSVISGSREDTDLEYEKYCKAKERNRKRLDFYHKKEKEQTLQQQTNTNICEALPLFTASSTKTSYSSNSYSTVQQTNTTAITNSSMAYGSYSNQGEQASFLSETRTVTTPKIDVAEVIEETVEELENSEVLFPPPSPLSHLKEKSNKSGLHKPESIPKYQRNWTALPSQSPARTPEPPELRENIPLAFVDVPKTPSAGSTSNPVYKPVAQISTSANKTTNLISSNSLLSQDYNVLPTAQHAQQYKPPPVHIVIEDRSGPVTMAFQSLDEHLSEDMSKVSSRPYTPSLINKPAPIIPFYQTPEKLCFDECPAQHARAYDRQSASPFPDRAHSPAPGPPPNPLSAIRAPRMKEIEIAPLSPRLLAVGSITTGQSYQGAQQTQQNQGQILSHHESSSQMGFQSITKNPETFRESKVGGITVQTTEKESHLDEQKRLQLESQTKTEIGNTQIERRRRVTEEFEHTQKEKTVEIRRGSAQESSTERRQSYGKTGFVANQARRLSCLEEEISNLQSQSQAISERAANLSESSFPQLYSPTTTSKFPTKPILPSHSEPRRPSYVIQSGVAAPPHGSVRERKPSYGAAIKITQPLEQQKSLSTTTNTTASSLFSSSSLTSSKQESNYNNESAGCCSLTKASCATNNNNKKDFSSYPIENSSNAAAKGICPVTGTFCRPGHTCCKQQQMRMQQQLNVSQNNNNNNSFHNAYRADASAGSATTDYRPPLASAASTADTAQKTNNMASTSEIANNNSGNNGSTGVGGKGGAFGATSAPKRGRGIYNKAVAPGVRVPLCNSCNMQIRVTNIANENLPENMDMSSTSMGSNNATELQQDDATLMLSESISKINMGNKMNNFMAEAGKIISNMLESRLANTMTKSDSTISLRSNNSSNFSKSPMVARKRFDLEDFKDIDPTEPVSLKPVVVTQQQVALNAKNAEQPTKVQPQVPLATSTLTHDISINHPMSKVLNICDKSFTESDTSNVGCEADVENANWNAHLMPENTTTSDASSLPLSEAVVYRSNGSLQKRSQRGGEHSTHALDRRSYIEIPTEKANATQDLSEHVRDGSAFSINVKALGPNAKSNALMSPENEEVVSQLLKDGRRPICCQCNIEIVKGPFITALGRIWCPDHFICVNGNCRRPLQDIGFVEEKGDLYCEYCFEKYLAPTCSKCGSKIKGDCLNAIGKHFHPECFTCGHCGKMFGNTPFFLEDGNAYCEADWNELFTTKCFACGFPVEAGDRWVEALNHNYHSQCFNCTYCKQNLEGQSFYNKGGRPFCKNHAR